MGRVCLNNLELFGKAKKRPPMVPHSEAFAIPFQGRKSTIEPFANPFSSFSDWKDEAKPSVSVVGWWNDKKAGGVRKLDKGLRSGSSKTKRKPSSSDPHC